MLEARPQARSEIREAFQWYESERAGLGDEFLAELQSFFDRVEGQPRLYGRVYRNYRGACLRRFSYIVLYRDHGPDAVVHAVLHSSRSRKTWRDRLRDADG